MARIGRPIFKATPALRREVAELVSCGMIQDDIARAIGCSTPTLQKHFDEELKTGTARKRAEVIKLLYRNARAGNVSAQKQLETMTKIGAASDAVGRRSEADPTLGKKEEQQAAAGRVEGKFAPPAPPKLVVDNR